MLIFLLVASELVVTDGRVFCQDSYAQPWKPLGHSCPISCDTVNTAVNRLKLSDYNRLLDQRIQNNISISDTDLMTIGKHLKSNPLISRRTGRNTKFNKHITIAYQRLFKNKTFVEDLKSGIDEMAAQLKNGLCNKMAAGKPLKSYILRQKCARTHNTQEFLKSITKILNKYSDKYMFTEEMTGLLLEKLLGHLDLRYGVMDVRRLLLFLQNALRDHDTHRGNDMIVTLKPKHCLTIKISGCFCKSGYVENAGQCVRPMDCITNPQNTEYLDRIIIA